MIAAIVVFVTTYALVLPAITLDVSRASREPGMVLEQMQFKTTASAASVTAADSTVEVQAEETQVEEPAPEEPAEEETIQEEPAESSEEETSAASDEQEEAPAEPEQAETPAEPAQEEAPAEKIEEGQEDKSEDSSSETASSSETDASQAQAADTQKSTDQASVDQSGTETTDAAAAAATAETAAEFRIPTLDALDFDDILTGRTSFYYYHPENAEEAENLSSDSIDDWKKADSDTVLAPEDFVRVYLSYEIPAGALNETNTEARYRLPAGLELSDKQIKAINKYENGIAASKSGSEHDRYLGAEAIEGSRTPDEKAGDEYISATVKVDKTNDNRQELVFTFIPYTVEKNQISYDEKGQVISKGKEVKGFFTFDLTTAQIDFEKTELETVEKEDGTTEEIQYSKAEVVFVKENNDKNIDEISSTLTLATPVEKEEPKTLMSEGSDYTVTVSYTEEAQIPDNAELAVREIEKDSDEYASYLEQAKGAVDETKSVNEARFFDITILADGQKVEPQAPVNVQITFAGIEQTNTDDTQLLHYKDDKDVEVVDQAEFSKSEDSEKEKKAVDTVQFEADGFSVYGIVGTETITTQYISASGDIYEITVTYDSAANIPEGAELNVSEVSRQTVNENGERYSDIAKGLLKVDAEKSEAVILFDISIVKNGQKIQPAAPVSVDIKLTNAVIDETAGVVHFGETKTEVLDAAAAENSATFETDSFSIFALKEIIDNEDGTYDLMLSVTGTSSSVTTYTDINVIFIMDTSQSMTFRATSETGSMVTWNPMTANIWGNSSYLDDYTSNRAANTGYNTPNEAIYFNLYKRTGNSYARVVDGDTTPVEQLYVRNGNNYYLVGDINISGRTPIRVSGSSTTDPTPTHPQNGGSTSHEDTRLWKTKTALESVMSSLAAKNTEANPDAVEMLLITFNDNATTGNWSTSTINVPTDYNFYTRWDRALSAAQTAAQNKKNAEASKEGGPDDTYVIFITDGTPTSYSGSNVTTAQNAATDLNNNYGGLHLVFAYGSDTSGNLQNLSHTGLYEAQSTEALVSALTSIMGQINNANAYEQVVYNDGVTSLTTSLVAKDIDNITFKKYRTVIEENGKYYYEDTYDTDKTEAPAANIATTTDADGNSVKYDETTGVAYVADYDFQNNALEWNVSDTRLEKGWLYTCRFTVWPSQEAYDLVADLNNGNRAWSSLTDDEKASIYDASGTGNGPFSLKTNTDGTKISYNEIKSQTSNKLPDGVTQQGSGYAYNGHAMTPNSDGSYTYVDGSTTYKLTIETNPETGGTTYTLIATTPGESTVTNPDPVALEDGDMLVRKVWDDEINPRNESNGVIFYLWKDGVKTTTKNGADRIVLPIGTGDDAVWYDTINVAPGLMTVEDGVVDVKETGHNYTLTEEIPSDIAGEYNDYSYEFSAQTVRPMEVNGHLKYLILVQEPYYTPDGATTYVIPDVTDHNGNTIAGGTYYEASGADDATLKGENHKTSELDITKEIDATLSDKTSAELDEETFTYTVTLNTPEGSSDHGVKLWIYTPVESGGFELPEYGNLRVTGESIDVPISGNTATVSVEINRTQIARFTNLPTDTTYTITETGANGSTLADEGYVVTGIGQGTSARPTPDSTSSVVANGVITETDTRYYNNYKNTLTSVDAELKVKKELSGYEWKDGDEYEFTVSASEGTPMPENTTVKVTSEDATEYTASFGEIRFTEPGTYSYTVTETNAGQVIDGIEYGAAKTITVTVERDNSGYLNVTNISEGYVAATDTAPASGTVTITNTWVVTEADALKVWENADGTDTAPDGATVVFTLYADGVELTPSLTVTLDGTADEVPTGTDPAGYESEAWKASFVNLPKYKVVNGVATEIAYTIKETTGYTGYKASTMEAVESGQTITNSQLSAEIKLLKIGDGQTSTTLDNVEFELYSTWEGADSTANVKAKDINGNEVGTIKTTGGGLATIGNLLPGTYYLVETKAPDGYNMLTDPVEIYIQLIDQDPGYTVSYNQKGYSASSAAGNLLPDTDGAYQITVSNPSGKELPMTGGSGTLPYTLGGIALIFAAALMYGFRLRRRERRLR